MPSLSEALATHRTFLENCLSKYKLALRNDNNPPADKSNSQIITAEEAKKRIKNAFRIIDNINRLLSEFELDEFSDDLCDQLKEEQKRINALTIEWLSLLPTIDDLGKRIQAARTRQPEKPFWTPMSA